MARARRRSTTSPYTWPGRERTGVTAQLIHPGDVKTEMWSVPISAQKPSASGYLAEPFLRWADWVEKTGGDDPEKAADLILNSMGDEAALVNGQFLWIKDGLQVLRSQVGAWERTSLPWQK